MKTETETLIKALQGLAQEIESPDGAANAAIYEAAERMAELVAQVELLAVHRHELLDLIYNNAIGQVAMGYSIDGEGVAKHAYAITGIDAASVTNSLPPTTQHLRDIQAEAGRVGYLACADEYGVASSNGSKQGIERNANQYAARVKAGEQ